MACSRVLIVIVAATAAAVILRCTSIILAQDFCGVTDDTRFQVDATEMFYLDIDHPICCSGKITSWRVCYYGPGANDDSKPYRVKYAVYRPNVTENNDTEYHLVPGSNRSTIICSTSRNCRRRGNNNKFYTRSFYCYKQSLDTHSHVVTEEGDVVGACVVDPNGEMKQLNIIGKVNGQPPDSVQLRGTKQLLHINLCKEGTNIPNSITLNQLSVVDSTKLHLGAKTTCTACMASITSEGSSDVETKIVCRPPDLEFDMADNIPAQIRQRQTYQIIMNKSGFNEVCNNMSVFNALEHLSHNQSAMIKRAVRDREVNLSVPIYLLSAAIKSLGRKEVDRSEITEPPRGIAGSTLLKLIDRFALNNHNLSHPITMMFNNIVFRVEEVRAVDKDSVFLIDEDSARIRLRIPREVVESTIAEGAPVRMASFLFRNMTGLLPESLGDGDQNTITDQEDHVLRLASPVISFSCDNCTTSNLSTPVEIIFTHSPYDKALLTNDENGTTTCVFWEFKDDQCQGSILFTGQWFTDGCETNFNSTSTVCRCNHLTHFAILLSARPLSDLLQAQILALQITGYIGVSVSLVAMVTTIFVFLFLKSLRTMRNYIHIQLCVTLGIAQIIFVTGVEPRLGEGGGVPIGCRSVAVLLHYWFLVSFMWMLMEGVVLYVALVGVFIKHNARYITAFTIASYGLPLLYVGGLTVPLGFVRTKQYREYHPYDYGYEQACYLNHHTSFVWSLLVPVILIFLANIGFFIMASVIMYKHQKRLNTDKKRKVKQWIKASISLTVVMGITWIIGFLVIEVEELFALAYIFTIFVAFQGVFIFVIFVPLSNQVQENYAKWWKAKVAESDFLSKHFGSKIFTSGTGVSAQNNNLPPASPVACSKTSRQSSGISRKAEQKLTVESCYDPKSESCS